MLSISTVFIIAPLILLVLIGVLLSVYEIKEDESAKLWIAGCLSLAIGYVFAAFRVTHQGDFIFAVSNICTFFGVVLTFFAFEKLLAGTDRSVVLATVAAIAWGVGLALTRGTPVESYIGLIVGATLGFIHLYFARRLIKIVKKPNAYIHVLIRISFTHGILWITRGAIGLMVGFYLISSQDAVNIAFVLVFVMLSTARQLIYLLLRLSATSDERKQLSALNEEKNKLITSLLKVNKTVATGALSATVAHEVNQPLTAIMLTANSLKSSLQSKDISKEQITKELEWIECDANRAADTIKTLKSIFQEKDLVVEPYNLREVIEFVLNLSSYDLKNRGITLQTEMADNCWANINASEIRQVLINILGNAVDALTTTDRLNKQISITASVQGSFVNIGISDNGHGISQEHQTEIFELLHSNKSHGSGLGLWLCRAILERHNGTIEHSTPENGGAMFTIKLPLFTSTHTWRLMPPQCD